MHDSESTDSTDIPPDDASTTPQHKVEDTDQLSQSVNNPDVTQFSIPAMDCPSCAQKVINSVRKLDAIQNIDSQVATGVLTVSYESGEVTPDAIISRIQQAGYGVENTSETTSEFTVPEMDCPSCANKVENALDDTHEIIAHETRPTTGTVIVRYNSLKLSDADIIDVIAAAGYEITESPDAASIGQQTTDERERSWKSPRAIKTWISGGFVGVGLLFEFVLLEQNLTIATVLDTAVLVADVLFLAAVVFGGQAIIRNGYYSARNLSLDIDFLMSVAILGAVTASFVFDQALYFEAATLAFLFSVAELLERYSIDRTRESLQELMNLSPDEATIKQNNSTETVPLTQITIGDIVVVKPGEKIPMDGTVVDGESAVNQAPITGESVPIDKTAGDTVYAGTINEEGYIELEVTSEASDNTLSRIVEMVENAQSNKTEREQFVERFSSYYTPVVVAFAIITMIASPYVLATTWSTGIVYGLTLLVLACPCAFVISTPVSVVSGITSAAKNGVLIKGGNHLEAIGSVDTVAFDKTGTLTTGELTVTDVIPLNQNSKQDVLRCARGLEQRSEHPIGEAIVAEAENTQTAEREIEEFESITGKGVRASLDGTPHFAGKPGLFEELGFDLSHVHATTDGGAITQTAHQMCTQNNCIDLLEETVPRLQTEGKTVVLVGTETELEGVIAVADGIRPEAEQTITQLKQLGISQTVMLTGDNERTARTIARKINIDTYQSELLPEEKVSAVESLVDEYDDVAMVGDGINDAPALATATVGVAMGAAGTDTALETADIALMGDNIQRLPYLYELANDANSIIRQNIWSSLIIKLGLAVAVPFGYVPIWLAVLAGDAGMTTAVTGNAMRLSGVIPDVGTEATADNE
ncbi:heavy metal translocating P-type ATPase [Haloquadratum walsbyi]|uniref:Heavy metal-(Cd/Co/Hg/Pb/Zn)-translocating P-type ATPase n=1 Tax=Haloquadratum walsbyi J07HQW2 TaxID=1238425 RepID=U1PXF4_9EURY|nr:heavy metal translocating P-type ATPase [Haloquadratum walsbyi]ERG97141.1 MAG: heavy metal-(Cd/Co/Hg/Pb/Zn)-translocating P-type ATPase [Haloquadratum walsbyi J07HQW2]